MEQSSGRLYPEDEEARTGAVLYVPQGGMTKWAAAFACLPISTSTQEMGGQGRRGRRRVGMRRSQPARAASLPAVLFGRCSKPAVCRCDRRRRKGKSFSRDHCCNTTPKNMTKGHQLPTSPLALPVTQPVPWIGKLVTDWSKQTADTDQACPSTGP
jgi:hypothetical protein